VVVTLKFPDWHVGGSTCKVKLALCSLWRHIRERRYITLLILNLGTRWGWVASFTLHLLYPQQKRNRRLDVAHSWSGHFGEERNFLPLLEIETWFLVCPACSLVTYTVTKLYCIYKHWEAGVWEGTWWCSSLRHCVTSRKVVGSIPDGLIGIFCWHNLSGCTVVMVSTRPVTEMSTRGIFWGVKVAGT
jgi:hypothetical protein